MKQQNKQNKQHKQTRPHTTELEEPVVAVSRRPTAKSMATSDELPSSDKKLDFTAHARDRAEPV